MIWRVSIQFFSKEANQRRTKTMNETTKIAVFTLLGVILGGILVYSEQEVRVEKVEIPAEIITQDITIFNGKRLPNCPLVEEGIPCVELDGGIYPSGRDY